MKRICQLFLLLFLCLTSALTSAQNLLYQKIEQEKSNGATFERVEGIFTRAESNNEILREFRNPEEVSFMEYNSEVVDELPRTISLEILLNNKTEIIELVAVDNDFYNYVVTTSENEAFPANRAIKHYRGVIENDQNSLAALSFSQEHVGGIVANDKGNFNVSLLNDTNNIITFNENNLQEIPDFECGTVDDGMADYDPDILNLQSKTTFALAEKCVRFYYEIEYDIFQNKGSILNVESYLSTIFNQVGILYENENIKTSISEIKIWTTPDPFNGGDTTTLLTEFQNHTSSFNGDLGQLLTFRSIGGGRAAGFSGLCNPFVSQRLSVSGIHSSHIINNIYSWNVMVITHEFGHIFGSRHTHACVWNGNNTAIDGCSGATEGSCGLPGIPAAGGTIMSYCHTQSVGINFSLGFGSQPGNLIRSRVANASCLNDCSPYCFENLNITSTVPNGYFDERKVSNNIIATNPIFNGASAEYSAGNSITLKPGFRSYSGSVTHLFISGCMVSKNSTGTNQTSSYKQEENNTVLNEDFFVNLYPNPTPDVITIESNEDIIAWEIADNTGKALKSEKVNNLKKFETDFAYLSTGVYFIRIYLANGQFVYKKMIKQ